MRQSTDGFGMLCDDTNLGHLGEATQLVENSLLHEEKVGVAQRPVLFLHKKTPWLGTY